VPHFAIDPGPLAPADLARLARIFNSGYDPASDQDVRIGAWLGRQVAAAYSTDRTPDVQPPPPPSRWARLGDRVSPSGKTLYRCGGCGRDSAMPDKSCPAGCGESP
jgi:hypothetical protein